MDIEKVITELRADITDSQERGLDMDESDWLCCSGIILTGNEARALLDEIDRLRQRCGELEAYYKTMQYKGNELTALNDRLSEMARQVRGDE